MKEVLYRFEGCNECPPIDTYGDLNPVPLDQRKLWLRCDEYEIVKKTPKGARVIDKNGKSRLVKFNTSKQFAWHTKQEALVSFIARKERQIEILEAQKTQSERYLQIARRILNPMHVIEKPWWEN